MTDGWRNEGTEEPRDLGMGLLLFRGREGGREVRREGGGGSEGERAGEGRRTDVGTFSLHQKRRGGEREGRKDRKRDRKRGGSRKIIGGQVR